MSQPLENLPSAGSNTSRRAEYRPPSPWTMQFRVVKAIVLRNMTAQYGDSRLGYVLGIIFPLMSLGVVFLMFGLRGKVTSPGFPLIIFLVTGYPVWLGFYQTYSRILQAASRSDSLLIFPQINQLDLILATVVLEFTTGTIVFIILMVLASVFAHSAPANVPAVLILYWAAMWIGMAVGLMLSALNRVVPTVVQFLNMFFRLIMWVSGIVFTVDRLPAVMLPYIQWNPLLHIVEGLRQNWISTYQAPVFDPVFIISVGFVLSMLGLALERATRRFVGA